MTKKLPKYKMYKATMTIYGVPKTKTVTNKKQAKEKAIEIYRLIFSNFDKEIELINKMVKIELRK